MSNIAKLLQQYSKESAELEPIDTVEEQMDPIDQLEELIELEESVNEEDGAVLEQEGDDIEEAIHTLVEANESLESHLDFLDEIKDKHGDIDDVSMKLFYSSVADSMEARGIPFEHISGGIALSTESSEKSDDAKMGFFKRIWAMIRAALQRMREWITRFLAWFRTSGKVVQAAAEKLLKVAEEKKKQGAKADGKKYNQRPFNDLALGGKVDPLKAILKVIQATNEAYASAGHLADVSIIAVDTIKSNSSGGKDAGLLAGIFGKSIEDVQRRYIKELSAITQKESLTNLPGDRSLKVEIKETKKGFRAKVTMVKPEMKVPVADRWAPVMSLDEIIDLAKNIIRLVVGLTKVSEDFEKKFEKTKQFDNFVPKDDDTKVAEVRELAALVSQGTASARAIASEFSSHVLPIAKRAYAAGLVNVRQYK